MTPSTPRPRLANFMRHPWWEQLAFAPVWALLGLGRLAILTTRFERIATALGTGVGTRAFVPLLTPREEARARRIASLVPWVASHTPWTSSCFPQALVARLLLGLAGVPWVLCFGLRRDSRGALAAHAWVVAGRVNVTGGVSFGRLTVVGCYSSLTEAQLAPPA